MSICFGRIKLVNMESEMRVKDIFGGIAILYLRARLLLTHSTRGCHYYYLINIPLKHTFILSNNGFRLSTDIDMALTFTNSTYVLISSITRTHNLSIYIHSLMPRKWTKSCMGMRLSVTVSKWLYSKHKDNHLIISPSE